MLYGIHAKYQADLGIGLCALDNDYWIIWLKPVHLEREKQIDQAIFTWSALGKRVFRFQLLSPPKRTLGILKWVEAHWVMKVSYRTGMYVRFEVDQPSFWPGVSQVMLIPQYVCHYAWPPRMFLLQYA